MFRLVEQCDGYALFHGTRALVLWLHMLDALTLSFLSLLGQILWLHCHPRGLPVRVRLDAALAQHDAVLRRLASSTRCRDQRSAGSTRAARARAR